MRNEFLLFISYPGSGTFTKAAWTDYGTCKASQAITIQADFTLHFIDFQEREGSWISVTSPMWWFSFLYNIPVKSEFSLIPHLWWQLLHSGVALLRSLSMYKEKVNFALISPQHSSLFCSWKLNRTSCSLFYMRIFKYIRRTEIFFFFSSLKTQCFHWLQLFHKKKISNPVTTEVSAHNSFVQVEFDEAK